MTWNHMGSPGNTWDHQGSSAIMYLRSSRIIWDHMGSSRIIWGHLGSSGNICNHLVIWAHLGSSAIIWDHLGSSWIIWEVPGRSLLVSIAAFAGLRLHPRSGSGTKASLSQPLGPYTLKLFSEPLKIIREESAIISKHMFGKSRIWENKKVHKNGKDMCWKS